MKCDLNNLSDWDLMQYLRYKKKWLLLPSGSKKDIQNHFKIKLTNDDWEELIRIADKGYDMVMCENLQAFLEILIERKSSD